MKTKIITILLALFCMGAYVQSTKISQGPLNEFSTIDGTSALRYNYNRERNIESRAGYGPNFYIFPDSKLDEKSALALAKELKLPEILTMIRLIAINNYGHWNFKPAARLIWDFFKHFSRDMETKKLHYTE